MKGIDVSSFLIKAYLDEYLYEFSEDFYYTIEKVVTPIEEIKLNIGNVYLEKRFPLVFTRKNPFCKLVIHKNETVSFLQSFDMLDLYRFKEGMSTKDKFEVSQNIMNLAVRVGEILNPIMGIRTINEEVDNEDKIKVKGTLPTVINAFNNGRHILSRIQMDWSRFKGLRNSDLLVNLNIFYMFFKDLQ